jgi:ubiquinone/menaquinone biosynthesis C-methylase UbiE
MDFIESIYKDFKLAVYNDLTAQQILEFYTKFANYYSEIFKFEGYRTHEIAVNGFVELGLEKSVRILDLGAGQGPCGRLLKSLGYENVDALDGTPAMLKVAKSSGIYKNYIHCLIDKNTKLPIEDNYYDAIIAASSIGMGHIGIEVLPELIRITKAGEQYKFSSFFIN